MACWGSSFFCHLLACGCAMTSGCESGQPWCSCGCTLLAKGSQTLRENLKSGHLFAGAGFLRTRPVGTSVCSATTGSGHTYPGLTMATAAPSLQTCLGWAGLGWPGLAWLGWLAGWLAGWCASWLAGLPAGLARTQFSSSSQLVLN